MSNKSSIMLPRTHLRMDCRRTSGTVSSRHRNALLRGRLLACSDSAGYQELAPPMSPTIFRERGLRFYFFSREEARIHVHVLGADGQANVWLEPSIEVAYNHGLRVTTVGIALALIREREHEIRTAWEKHFRS